MFQTRNKTITIYDHLRELRSELRACIDAEERTQIAAELEAAEAELAEGCEA